MKFDSQEKQALSILTNTVVAIAQQMTNGNHQVFIQF
jgi:hypothetical protein